MRFIKTKNGKRSLIPAFQNHIRKLVLKAAFQVCFTASNIPKPGLFKCYQQALANIHASKHTTGIHYQFFMNRIDKGIEIALQFPKE